MLGIKDQLKKLPVQIRVKLVRVHIDFFALGLLTWF